MNALTEAEFLCCVKNLRLTELTQVGVHRTVRFRPQGSLSYWFYITTWPGYLCICGDMGSYTFSRLNDMFDFFRGARVGELKINPQYWAEKLVAEDRIIPAKVYSATRFAQLVIERAHEAGADAQALESIRAHVLSATDDEHSARARMNDFDMHGQPGLFDDAWEWDLRDYSRQYLWCCYAIVWAIRQYDAHMETKTAPADTPNVTAEIAHAAESAKDWLERLMAPAASKSHKEALLDVDRHCEYISQALIKANAELQRLKHQPVVIFRGAA